MHGGTTHTLTRTHNTLGDPGASLHAVAPELRGTQWVPLGWSVTQKHVQLQLCMCTHAPSTVKFSVVLQSDGLDIELLA